MDMSGGEEEKTALEQYGVDLTARAKAGKLDPVIIVPSKSCLAEQRTTPF
jgi:ATP-dependent Clp protease ATP-binding subunit ClpA